MVERNGTWKMALRYRAYGTTIETSGSLPFSLSFRWAGAQYDEETGFYYLRARYYDPSIGRFVQEDPLGDAGGPNLYAYTGGDPTRHRDPNGTADGLDDQYWWQAPAWDDGLGTPTWDWADDGWFEGWMMVWTGELGGAARTLLHWQTASDIQSLQDLTAQLNDAFSKGDWDARLWSAIMRVAARGPYGYGRGPGELDCSLFVIRVLQDLGLDPGFGTTHDAASSPVLRPINAADVKTGDIFVEFGTGWNHMGFHVTFEGANPIGLSMGGSGIKTQRYGPNGFGAAWGESDYVSGAYYRIIWK